VPQCPIAGDATDGITKILLVGLAMTLTFDLTSDPNQIFSNAH